MGITVALAGNPNSGKTTLFNKLTGAKQHVGNWPGVTIEKKTGTIHKTDAELVDMPGIYSLSPYTPEENITRNFLVGESPDVILNIVDASNIERNLYLTLQLLDLNIPTVVALNMMDTVDKNGDRIDVKALTDILGCKVVPISALKGTGLKELTKAIVDTGSSKVPSKPIRMNDRIESLIDASEKEIRGKVPEKNIRWFAIKLVENDEIISTELKDSRNELSDDINGLEAEYEDDAASIITDARYRIIENIVSKCVRKGVKENAETLSDRVDKVITHRIFGLPMFIAVIGVLFMGIIGYGDYPGIGTYFTDMLNGWIEESLQPAVADWCADMDVSDELTSLLVSGVVGGVGAVIGFLPQMLILFLALCILEDIGYMARAAFMMDRVFRFFGLSGKSFIPLLVGMGCGVPGIMSSRTIESERDRRITAMTVTFVPCGAKLPVIAMIAGALFHNNGLIALFVYVVGIVSVLVSGIILKKFKGLSGRPAPFVMELPPYHIPSWINVLKGTLDRGLAFVKKAGTLILLASILIWFLASYNGAFQYVGDNGTTGSMLESFGRATCIIFQPLGWGDNWQFTVGSITGLMAKENLVSTLVTLFSVDDEGEAIYTVLAAITTPAAGLSFLMFNMLCAPCFAAIGAMHRELGTWKATGAAVLYQCVFAYAVASIIYVIASLIYGETAVVSGWIIAILSIVAIVALIVRKEPYTKEETA